MDNAKKIKIMEELSDIVKSRSLIQIPEVSTKFEYLVEMYRKRLIILKPVSTKKYIWPFYIEHEDFIQFVFPTPPFENKINGELREILSNFISETRSCISEILDKKPQKIVLDLRNNVGGYLYVFYNSLLPLLPIAENQLLLTGVDKLGKEHMKMLNSDGKMILEFKDGKEIRDMLPVTKRPECEIEVWVNNRSASSAELISILFEQEGHKVIGRPTLGLTTGMSGVKINGAEMNFPIYIFKNKHGEVYQPRDSHITIGEEDDYEFTGIAGSLQKNVLVKLPKKLLENISPELPIFNNIVSEYFGNNYHSGIEYEKTPISYFASSEQIYIHIPKKCKTKISEVLDECWDLLKIGTPVLIDIRNSKFGEDNEEFMSIFDGMYRPWKVELIDTSHNQEDGHDSKLNKLSKYNLVGEYAYVANKRPYTFAFEHKDYGKYSEINARFWTNKYSISSNITSCIFLLYVKSAFGLFSESTLPDYYEYSFHRYVKENIEVHVYSDRFLDKSK